MELGKGAKSSGEKSDRKSLAARQEVGTGWLLVWLMMFAIHIFS